jgi:predicted transcriptional regulator
MERDGRNDRELVRALSHPIRVEILETLQGRVASSRELSQEMDRSLGVIAYHASTLVRCGCLELVETEPRQGGGEHFFGVTPGTFVSQQRWRSATESQRTALTRTVTSAFMVGARRLLSQLHARNRQADRKRAR